MKNRRIAELLILFGVMFLPGYFSQTQIPSNPSFDSWFFHIQYAVLALPHIFLVLYFMSLRGPAWPEQYGFAQFRLADVARGLAVSVILIGVALPVLAVVTRLSGPSQALSPVSTVILVPAIVTFTLGAVREEAFFRSFLLTELDLEGISSVRAVIGSSLLFALGHAYQGWAGIVTTLILGMILGMIFVRRRNAYEVMIGHVLYNIATLLFWLIQSA